MSMTQDSGDNLNGESLRPKRRLRYSGKNPRRFDQKYKELRQDPETLRKVMDSGKTPAGMHRPIMLDEVLSILNPKPGDSLIDCTLGFGGHSTELLKKISPEGKLLGLDTDPLEIQKTSARLSKLAEQCGSAFISTHSNYAGMARWASLHLPEGVDGILADLGLSSMQIDDPMRGFSYKIEGPLDMRMNPEKGLSARDFLLKSDPVRLAKCLAENADEPRAELIAQNLAGRDFPTTIALRRALEKIVPAWAIEDTIPRVFQAIRIAVNDEFSALTVLLQRAAEVLKPGARFVVLTFHSGEDRRVKQSFKRGLEEGVWSSISEEVLRPSPREVFENPRASCAKLRWAQKA